MEMEFFKVSKLKTRLVMEHGDYFFLKFFLNVYSKYNYLKC